MWYSIKACIIIQRLKSVSLYITAIHKGASLSPVSFNVGNMGLFWSKDLMMSSLPQQEALHNSLKSLLCLDVSFSWPWLSQPALYIYWTWTSLFQLLELNEHQSDCSPPQSPKLHKQMKRNLTICLSQVNFQTRRRGDDGSLAGLREMLFCACQSV